jgi:hypothetical protein
MLASVVSLQGIKDPMISWQIVVNHLRFNNCMVLERLNFRLNDQVFLHHKIFRLFSIIKWHHKIYIALTKYSDLLSGLYTSILEWWSKAVCTNWYIDIYFLMCIFDLSCWNFLHLYWSACANQCHNSQHVMVATVQLSKWWLQLNKKKLWFISFLVSSNLLSRKSR